MRLGACLFWLVCSGCSALALSDEVHQSNCQANVDCEILNDRTSHEFDPCHIWQCDQRSKLCVF